MGLVAFHPRQIPSCFGDHSSKTLRIKHCLQRGLVSREQRSEWGSNTEWNRYKKGDWLLDHIEEELAFMPAADLGELSMRCISS